LKIIFNENKYSALKGRFIKAQGNALGTIINTCTCRKVQPIIIRTKRAAPGALPQAIIIRPVGAE